MNTLTESQAQIFSDAADRAIAWLTSLDAVAEKVVEQKKVYDKFGTEIKIGSIVRAKGSKIDRVVSGMNFLANRVEIVADRVDGKDGVSWRSWMTSEGLTVQ